MLSDTKIPNRLVNEKSPYLAEHANNPVDWWPWCEEAFAKAKAEDKPVFLSIGYSACHWCHVMERESFTDPEVAEALNRSFVSILVDREQRPDVDAIYMTACQAMTGQGGWPLTALLTFSQTPFFTATYLPKSGLLAVLAEAKSQWTKRRDKVSDLAARLSKAVREQFHTTARPVPLDESVLQNGVRAYARGFDAEWGGLGVAPKFPMAHTLLFLMRQSHLTGDAKALSMAETTLSRMCEGGLFDHVGGGFMRYSTDRKWEEPHYEKMLNDNALLVMAYLEAWQRTEKPLYRRVAERTLEYVLREMTDEAGGFYTAQDADVDGREGAYYQLTRKELESWLGKEDGAAYAAYYLHGDAGLPNRIGYEGGVETRRMTALSQQVLARRAERLPLGTDKKQLASWNGLMIGAFAYAYRATGDTNYLDAAERAALCVRTRLLRPDGSLFSHWIDGAAYGEGLLDDYAELAMGLLWLYQATLSDPWLSFAVNLSRAILSRFEDRERGGFFMTPHGGEALIARPKETYDGAAPSGNATALAVLAVLSALDVGEGWDQAAERQAAFLSGLVSDSPLSHMGALLAAMPLAHPVTLVDARAQDTETQRFLSALRGHYAPQLYLKATQPGSGGSSFRVCKGTTCLAPFQQMEGALGVLKMEESPQPPLRH